MNVALHYPWLAHGGVASRLDDALTQMALEQWAAACIAHTVYSLAPDAPKGHDVGIEILSPKKLQAIKPKGTPLTHGIAVRGNVDEVYAWQLSEGDSSLWPQADFYVRRRVWPRQHWALTPFELRKLFTARPFEVRGERGDTYEPFILDLRMHSHGWEASAIDVRRHPGFCLQLCINELEEARALPSEMSMRKQVAYLKTFPKRLGEYDQAHRMTEEEKTEARARIRARVEARKAEG